MNIFARFSSTHHYIVTANDDDLVAIDNGLESVRSLPGPLTEASGDGGDGGFGYCD